MLTPAEHALIRKDFLEIWSSKMARDHEIEGVEVWHTRNREGDAERFMQIATQYHLIMTGGTDFHGMYSKVTHPLGTCTTPDDQLTLLKKLRVE